MQKRKRPYSSASSYSRNSKNITLNIHTKNFRVNEQDIYNNVRNNVYDTFKVHTSRSYDLIKELIDNKAPQKQPEIDRICKKYSILNNKKNRAFEGVNVNVQSITKHYIKSKSKQKKKQEERKRLKIDIAKTYRYGPKKQYAHSEQFFSFQGNDLKNMQKKQLESYRKANAERKKQLKQSSKHPYLKIYEIAQQQAIQNIMQNKSLLMESDDFPNFPQLEDWEKNTINLKEMMNQKRTVRKKREIQSARPRIVSRKSQFYLS